MCGIAGILLSPRVSGPRVNAPWRLRSIDSMNQTLRHRGPDDGDSWLDVEAGLAFGHRRLAIVDLSPLGRQPMHSADGRFVITYNGEVYNAAKIGDELRSRGHVFRGHSDTEIILAACQEFGLRNALSRFVGMFAFGLWDRRDRVLHLVRDRFGKKPLYVTVVDGALLFASELRALRAGPGFTPHVDPAALAAVLQQGWVPDDACIWQGVIKLPPGSCLSITAAELDRCSAADLQQKATPWWSLRDVVEVGQRDPFKGDEQALDDELEALLQAAVNDRMVADVPLGAFLSGGVDSSLVVALMQARASRPVRTFTIGFDAPGFDEASAASLVAHHLGTDHTALRLRPAQVWDVLPDLPNVWDEPFADESQIPTLLVSQLARRHVTVALSGDGGDEVFGGYTRHVQAVQYDPLFRLPGSLRRFGARTLGMLHPDLIRQLQRNPATATLAARLGVGRLPKLADALNAESEDALYAGLLRLDAGMTAPRSHPSPAATQMPALTGLAERIMFRDTGRYLPGDILVKLDRASMAVSLEARCPLLDHRVVEFAWRLPLHHKIRGGKGKLPLRRLLRKYVPEPVAARAKHGFNVPIGEWLRGPLRPWAEDTLSESRLRSHGLLDVARVRTCLARHISGGQDHAYALWAILMVQSWLDTSQQAIRMPDSEVASSDARALALTAQPGAVS
ncbi:asparagine synthase (glutamine-hydrolyzing) [Rhodopila sp.]|uniref:asparagine synthase (glutamine-hydrolyzing) n=1 Tax=Rhodopila sp. TaxID=2480087 RepID=UPI003D0C30B7